jgi:hypothetical protein
MYSQCERIFLLIAELSYAIGSSINWNEHKNSKNKEVVEQGKVAASSERIYEIIHILGCEHTDIYPDAAEVESNHNLSDNT